jgi:hypothetical protein
MPKDVYNEPLTTVEELKKALNASAENSTDANATADGSATTGDAPATI